MAEDHKTVEYWIEIAEYDLGTAKAMYKTKRFLYVAFMCHQTIEKSLKALYVYFVKKIPPFSHGLTYLAEKCNIYNDLTDDQKDFLDSIEPLNIEARYPLYKEKISKTLSKKECREIINKTEEFHKWLMRQLSKK